MFWLQPSVVYIKPFTPRSWRTTTQAPALLEVPGKATVIEFFLHLVAMERILVVFLRIQRKSTKEDHDRMERPVVCRSLAKTSDEWLSRIHSFLLQIDRLQLTAVYCNRRCVKTTPQKTRFRDEKYAIILGYRLSGRWQDTIGLQHPEGKNFALGVAFAWWNAVYE